MVFLTQADREILLLQAPFAAKHGGIIPMVYYLKIIYNPPPFQTRMREKPPDN